MTVFEAAAEILRLARRFEAGEISAGVLYFAITYVIDDCTDEIIDAT